MLGDITDETTVGREISIINDEAALYRHKKNYNFERGLHNFHDGIQQDYEETLLRLLLRQQQRQKEKLPSEHFTRMSLGDQNHEGIIRMIRSERSGSGSGIDKQSNLRSLNSVNENSLKLSTHEESLMRSLRSSLSADQDSRMRLLRSSLAMVEDVILKKYLMRSLVSGTSLSVGELYKEAMMRSIRSEKTTEYTLMKSLTTKPSEDEPYRESLMRSLRSMPSRAKKELIKEFLQRSLMYAYTKNKRTMFKDLQMKPLRLRLRLR